ncbi:hypothetical protein TNCV_1341671 [Trichonephila clavipes]|uniref:Uncharacterized protein n=1 Tax=Trichonephila clavipes TaxID=2585209 RepID=A0A8X6VA56_TRICX|nr:hypothetical protein TNCV_1341671 [Trichonephila clavipes]
MSEHVVMFTATLHPQLGENCPKRLLQICLCDIALILGERCFAAFLPISPQPQLSHSPIIQHNIMHVPVISVRLLFLVVLSCGSFLKRSHHV